MAPGVLNGPPQVYVISLRKAFRPSEGPARAQSDKRAYRTGRSASRVTVGGPRRGPRAHGLPRPVRPCPQGGRPLPQLGRACLAPGGRGGAGRASRAGARRAGGGRVVQAA